MHTDSLTTPALSLGKASEAFRARSKSPRKLRINRHFSTVGIHPFDQIEWATTTAEIKGDTGAAVFRQEGIEAPASWSPLATKIAVSKYFYGDIANGTDPFTGGRESSVRQLISRVTDTITEWGMKDGYFANKKSAEAFRSELTWLCVNQHGAFNSPVWFNVGLFAKYGVGANGGKGLWAVDRKTGKASRVASQYERPQASACFIQKVEDTMEGILALAETEAMLFKFGSGTGTNLSTLRSTREKLSGGGKPSGPLSFLKVYDQIAGTVKSGGKTRRAAKMNTLNTTHPDIEEFIDAKMTEERKAWALIEQGYDGSYNGDAYGSVMYQNENLSIRASDDFMNAALEGRPWWTMNVTDGMPCEQKDATALLRKIAEGTHVCGDPGMQFDTTIDDWHTCKGTGRQTATNPCSEYLFLDGTACNLASLNLLKFKKADGSFNVESFKAACRIFIIAQDILVDSASYPTQTIAENSHIFRTLGLGFANLGALVMSYGLGYDSDEGRALAGAITAIMTGQAYEQSAALAEVKGPFKGFHNAAANGFEKPVAADNVAPMLAVIRKHTAKATELAASLKGTPLDYLADDVSGVWENALAAGETLGFRNAQVTVLAPTGTIGFLMDCDTTGIEPDLALVKYKLLAGGGNLKIVNQTVPAALKNLGYDAEQVARMLAFIEANDTIEGAPDLKASDVSVFDCAFKAQKGTRSLSYMGHLTMMAACQPFLSGAISKTVNLPETATVEEIMQTYIAGWKMGLKAIAIYRDGSKRSAPLSTKQGGNTAVSTSNASAQRIAELEAEVAALKAEAGKPLRRRLPDTRDSKTHKFSIAGHEGYITAGMFPDGTPGELFIQMSKEGSTIGGLMDTIGTLTSLALQNGVPLDSLVSKFSYQRFEPSGFTSNPDIRNATSITDYLFRWLGCTFIDGYRAATAPKAYVPEGEAVTVEAPTVAAVAPVTATPAAPKSPRAALSIYMDTTCSNCGSHKVIRAGACGTCSECGTAKGCS